MVWFPGQRDKQTLGTVNCPLGPSPPPPPHTVVKQTTSAEGSPTVTLLLLYGHRQDLSPSIYNAAVWTTTPEICNTFNHSSVATSTDTATTVKCYSREITHMRLIRI